MGKSMATWFFERKVSAFELLAVAVGVTTTDGFWPLFIITAAAALLATRMQKALGLDND